MSGMQVFPGNHMEIVSPRLVQAADMVVIQRDFPRFRRLYAEVLAQARQAGIPVVYDLDDDLLALPDSHPDRQTDYYQDAYHTMMQAMLDADLVTTTTTQLSERLQPFNKNVQILPNYLNDQIWSMEKNPEKTERNHPLIIGYFLSPSHIPDLALLETVLVRLLKRFEERVQLHIWGSRPSEALMQRRNVHWAPAPMMNYARYASFLRAQPCDLTIAPLADNVLIGQKAG